MSRTSSSDNDRRLAAPRKITKPVGVGLRHTHYQDALCGTASVDFVELHSENFFAEGGVTTSVLEAILDIYPVSLHGTSMGLGSAIGLETRYLNKLKSLNKTVNPFLVSDHASFSWSRVNNKLAHAGDLLPLPFTNEALSHLVTNVNRVQDELGQQILVENLASYVQFDHSTMTETEFLNELVNHTSCGLLLDLNNLLVNAHNFPNKSTNVTPVQSAKQWLDEIPVDAVREFHLAGYTPSAKGNFIVDDHSQPINDECWSLYRYALQRFGPQATLIEWDNNLPEWKVLTGEADKARQLIQQHTQTMEAR
ncbi:MNIO family bufferin maturase [Pseudomaricurvus sp.]|uniref:MNIO family bufferin maturase n=1 Tax=Pseudomaricurvus sp. TaxID=2004510 RepID=UPI003F6D9B45